MNKQLDVLQLFVDGWALIKRNWLFLTGFGTLVYLPTQFNDYFDQLFDTDPLDRMQVLIALGTIFVLTIVYAWLFAMMACFLRQIYLQREVSVGDAYKLVNERYLRFLLANVGVILITFMGIILFVIPGIYWGILYSQAAYVALFDKQQMNSFRFSARLTRPHFWSVFWFYAVLIALTSLPDILFGILHQKNLFLFALRALISGFVGIFGIAASIILYHRLNQAYEARMLTTETRSTDIT